MGDFDRNGGSDRRRSGGSRGRDPGRSNRGRSGGSDRRGSGRDRRSERHEMHSAICDKCGKNCEVPFKPTQGKPIYCSDCFKDKSREDGSRSEFGRPSGKPSDGNFDQINEKLNKILKILEAAKEPVEEKEQPELKKPKKIEEEQPELEYAKSEEKKKPKKKKPKKKKS